MTRSALHAVVLSIAAALLGACVASGTDEADEATAGADSALIGAVESHRIPRIKAAYKAASAEDFVPAPDLADASAFANASMRAARWSLLEVDDRTIAVVEFVPEVALARSFAHAPEGGESYVAIYALNGAVLDAALIYRPKFDIWRAASSALPERIAVKQAPEDAPD